MKAQIEMKRQNGHWVFEVHVKERWIFEDILNDQLNDADAHLRVDMNWKGYPVGGSTRYIGDGTTEPPKEVTELFARLVFSKDAD